MKFLFDFFPVLLFFLTFKFYDIYAATMVGIAATFIQVFGTRLIQKRWDRNQLITFIVFFVFGGMTLYFHDPIFVKWKPTIVFGVFALIIIGSQLLTSKTVIQRLLEGVMNDKGEVPGFVWKRLNLLWAMFFSLMSAVNLYVAYQLSDEAWVNFKFYGITMAVIAMSVVQTIYLAKFMTETKR